MGLNKRWLWLAASCAVALSAAIAWQLWPGDAEAADHLDPSTQFDQALDGVREPADIDDIYAWHTDDGDLVAVLTFGGPFAPDNATEFSADVRYEIHVNDATIEVQLGQNDADEWGFRARGIPGVDCDVVGDVGTALEEDDYSIVVNTFDDPFFFDLEGFRATAGSLTGGTDGSPMFDPDRDTFAGLNTHAIVIQFPLAAVTANAEGTPYHVWASTSVTGG